MSEKHTPGRRLSELELFMRRKYLDFAAPDLLEAARVLDAEYARLVDLSEEAASWPDEEPITIDVTMGELRAARAAIAKAEGRE